MAIVFWKIFIAEVISGNHFCVFLVGRNRLTEELLEVFQGLAAFDHSASILISLNG